jgi:putative CocE/NonD family hydrolase
MSPIPRLLLSVLLAAQVTAQVAAAAPAPVPPNSQNPSADRPLIPHEIVSDEDRARAIREHYTKYEYRIPMRDGVRLFTHVFVPKDRSQTYPMLLMRTPYGIGPYGIDNYPSLREPRSLQTFTPAPALIAHGMIFVFQDVRGKMMSEGEFRDVTPYLPNKRSPKETDEASDAYDTIDWLVKHVAGNNGKLGIWGNSYGGFYAAQAAIDAHPALKAVSPQMPVTEWFLGDDFHHNGALFLADALLFYANFGKPRPQPTPKGRWDFEPEMGDLYDYFLRIGPLHDADVRVCGAPLPFWRALVEHQSRDAYWRARDPRPHLRNLRPAVMTVGGLYDAEDLFGAMETYHTIEKQSPGTPNTLVLGPWQHGGQYRSDGEKLGELSFSAKTARFYQDQILVPFFLSHLKGIKSEETPEAWAFETGTNVWRRYATWPPKAVQRTPFWFHSQGQLSQDPPVGEVGAFDGYVSDPKKPVPYRERTSSHRDPEYMIEDQRFAARRPDVAVYTAPVLDHDVTVAGPIEVDLWVSTTGSDADFVVKLIDVFPDSAADPEPNPRGVRMGGYQALVRGEVMHSRFRNSFEKPEPLLPNTPTRIRFTLPDVNHTFRASHRIMVQVQSSWFPLVDRNPQQFVDIYRATEKDFVVATHKLYRGGEHRSSITLPLL